VCRFARQREQSGNEAAGCADFSAIRTLARRLRKKRSEYLVRGIDEMQAWTLDVGLVHGGPV
jgi:hypothetical protein